MSEVVNVVVAVAVIFFAVRWATSASRETPEEQRVRSALGFRPKNATHEMVETIASMFPDMPRENIHFDLLRTGSVEQTTNKIIERGYLDAPPPTYFRIYPRPEGRAAEQGGAQPIARAPSTSTTSNANIQRPTSAASSSSSSKNAPSLIQRYHLEERLSSNADGSGGGGLVIDTPEQAGGKASWEATPERREASLRERKAQMVLAARKRLLEQQKASESGATSSS